MTVAPATKFIGVARPPANTMPRNAKQPPIELGAATATDSPLTSPWPIRFLAIIRTRS